MIRELHVLGTTTKVGAKLRKNVQHRGLGKKFLKEVEPFMLREAMTMLERVEEYINGYLQVDKFRGN